MKEEKEIQLLRLETGLLWPYYKGKKAWSTSKLTKFLKEIEYKDIPEHILQAAKKRGESFHNTIQEFFQNGNYPSFVDQPKTVSLSKLDSKVHETINFLRKNKTLKPGRFLAHEKLHYVFYKGELLASYIDLEFQNCIIELKSNNFKSNNNSPFCLLIFEIQLLIQYLCTNKDVCLLWSTGEGVIFSKFKISEGSLKILDVLIDLARNEELYSSDIKKLIMQEMINIYPQKKLIIN